MNSFKLIFLYITSIILTYLVNSYVIYFSEDIVKWIFLALVYSWFFVELFKFLKTNPTKQDENIDIKNKYLPLFPVVIFSIYNILHIYALNILSIPLFYVIFSLFAILAINLTIYFILSIFIKKKVTASILTCFYILLFNIFIFFKIYSLIFLYYLSFVLIYLIILKLNKTKIFKTLCIISSFLLCFNLYDIISGTIKCGFFKVQNYKREISFNRNISKNLPNVYILLLDSYPNNEVLKREFNFDNKDFIIGLKKRGFFVYDEMWANYSKTIGSVASILNQDYINNLDFMDTSESIMKAKLFYNAKKYGYNTMFINSFNFFRLSDSYYIDEVIDLSKSYTQSKYLISSLFFKNTLYFKIFKKFDNLKKPENDLFWPILSRYSKINKNNQFVFAHILKPHWPYTKDEYGNDVYEEDFFENGINKINKEACLKFIKYTNKRALDIVDSILSNSGENTYLIILGDHGLRLLYSEKSDDIVIKNKRILNAAFNTFVAIHSPSKQYESYKQANTLLDFFKLFSNDLFKTNYKLEKNKFYYIFFKQHECDFKDIRKNSIELKNSVEF